MKTNGYLCLDSKAELFELNNIAQHKGMPQHCPTLLRLRTTSIETVSEFYLSGDSAILKKSSNASLIRIQSS